MELTPSGLTSYGMTIIGRQLEQYFKFVANEDYFPFSPSARITATAFFS